MSKSKLSQQSQMLAKMGKKQVAVGWFPENRYPNGEQVAQVMFWNEYGTVSRHPSGAVFVTPARPLMRYTATTVVGPLRALAKRMAPRMLNGQITEDRALMTIGELVIGEISTNLNGGPWLPNSQLTVDGLPPLWEGKGFNKPLVHTGHLGQSVQYKIQPKGSTRDNVRPEK